MLPNLQVNRPSNPRWGNQKEIFEINEFLEKFLLMILYNIKLEETREFLMFLSLKKIILKGIFFGHS